MEQNRLREILQKRLLNQELTASEERDLAIWLTDPANKVFYDEHIQSRKVQEVAGQVLDLNEGRLDRKMQGALRPAMHPVPQLRPARRTRVWWAAAGIVLLAGGVWLWETRSADKENNLVATARPILPATNRARLKLANDSIVYLDSTRNGTIATQGKVAVTKTGGELSYDTPTASAGQAIPTGSIAMNELSVPRAGQFQLRLPDGTRVWLNSATDISYPVAFGKERRIRINGEAYLDVVKDPDKPFIVETARGITQVLGTSFDVNAYADDSVEMITVISGAVSVRSGQRMIRLNPGEQAYQRADRFSLEHPNLPAITAWRRGFFYFQDADVRTIMRQISRFYNVTVRYETQPSAETYDGLISRDQTLAEVLAGLNKLNIRATLAGDSAILVAPQTSQK